MRLRFDRNKLLNAAASALEPVLQQLETDAYMEGDEISIRLSIKPMECASNGLAEMIE